MRHGYLIDMDGVLYRGHALIPGADAFVHEQAHARTLVLVSQQVEIAPRFVLPVAERGELSKRCLDWRI